MGMYTAFHLGVSLTNPPKEVIDILRYMTTFKRSDIIPPPVPAHPFFFCDRWSSLMIMDSAYFKCDTHCSLRQDTFDANCYYLTVTSNLKNYDDEILKFMDWIMPYLDVTDDMLGYYRYEEDDAPTILYHAKKGTDL
jgi:hypothetical protein